MKILFVCSCLEPGVDGVGDYTRRLAVELTNQGHTCSVLALADHLVQKPTSIDLGDDYGAIPALRLPRRDSWAVKASRGDGLLPKLRPRLGQLANRALWI